MVLIGTIHSLYNHLLQQYLGEKDLLHFDILTEEKQISFINSKLSNLGSSPEEVNGNLMEFSYTLASVFNYITEISEIHSPTYLFVAGLR